MSLLHSNSDLRVAADGRVWVLVPAGVEGRVARWRAVELRELRLDAAIPQELLSPYARHSLAGLDTDARRLAHDMGLPIRDDEKLREMWDLNRHIRGSHIAIDFTALELTRNPEHHRDRLVWPLSAFGTVISEGRLQVRQPARGPAQFIDIGEFPLGTAPIARAIALHAGGIPRQIRP